MKEPFKFILFVVLLVGFFSACSEDSSSAPEEPVDTFDANVVCPAEGMNAYGEPNRGTFTDARDGQVYKYTTIGNQVWMAENLKFDAPYSLCYDEIEGFCEMFGRFYTLHENGEDLGHFDQELLDTICPAGWHVPSVDEWSVLMEKMGGGGTLLVGYTVLLFLENDISPVLMIVGLTHCLQDIGLKMGIFLVFIYSHLIGLLLLRQRIRLFVVL